MADVHHIKLAVIAEPTTPRYILAPMTPGMTILVQGEGTGANVSMDCGACDTPLAVGIYPSQIRNLVLKCGACGALNESLDS